MGRGNAGTIIFVCRGFRRCASTFGGATPASGRRVFACDTCAPPPLKRRATILMTDDSLEILWRGADPAKFTALQAALRDDGIRFWHTQVYDPAGGFLSSRPYYLEAVPGFEIRVHSSDLEKANAALEWVESKENVPLASVDHSSFDRQRGAPKQTLPHDWDS